MRGWIITVSAVILAWLGLSYLQREHPVDPAAMTLPFKGKGETRSEPVPSGIDNQPLPSDTLMQDYGKPSTPPLEDLKMIQRVLLGYFSVVKDTTRFPIGGNADLSAALLGENANRKAFIRPDHPAMNAEGQLIDRWSTPVFVHPEASRELSIRSAGPDRRLFTEDDLVLLPNGARGDSLAPATSR